MPGWSGNSTQAESKECDPLNWIISALRLAATMAVWVVATAVIVVVCLLLGALGAGNLSLPVPLRIGAAVVALLVALSPVVLGTVRDRRRLA